MLNLSMLGDRSNGRSRKECADYDQEGAGVDAGVGREGELAAGLFARMRCLQVLCTFIWE